MAQIKRLNNNTKSQETGAKQIFFAFYLVSKVTGDTEILQRRQSTFYSKSAPTLHCFKNVNGLW